MPTFSQSLGLGVTVSILFKEEIISFIIRPSGNHLNMAHIPLLFDFAVVQRMEKPVWVVLDMSSRVMGDSRAGAPVQQGPRVGPWHHQETPFMSEAHPRTACLSLRCWPLTGSPLFTV